MTRSFQSKDSYTQGEGLDAIRGVVIGFLEPVEEGDELGLLDMTYQSALLFRSWVPILRWNAQTDMFDEQDSLSKLHFFVSCKLSLLHVDLATGDFSLSKPNLVNLKVKLN